MKTLVLEKALPHKIADISLAEWGRKEMQLAENEMPDPLLPRICSLSPDSGVEPHRVLHWAQSVGPATAQLFAEILKSKPHPEMGYRSCLGILRLGQRYSSERLEAAARRAVSTGACS